MTSVKVSSTFERVTHGNRTVTYAIPGVLRSLLHGCVERASTPSINRPF